MSQMTQIQMTHMESPELKQYLMNEVFIWIEAL